MAKSPDRFDGPDSFTNALRMARYGHREWLYWSDHEGEHTARMTAISLKGVLIKVGTLGKWGWIAGDGVARRGFWWAALKG